MHRTYTVLFLLTAFVGRLTAQPLPPGNVPDATQWINYQQTYYKLSIARNGLYRITTADLQKAGVPVTTIDPTTVQLFHRGVEQAISVVGEADKRFDTTDYLEFYGQGNDGATDSLLYQPGTQPHPYYSLYSDTTAYFLTWRLNGQPGKRMAAYTDTTYAGLSPEPYHWAEERRVLTQTYPAGSIYPLGADYSNGAILTGYDLGEGWTGPVVKTGARYEQVFTMTNLVTMPGVNPQLSFLVVGRNAQSHRVAYVAGASTTSPRTLGEQVFENYNTTHFDAELLPTDVSPAGNVTLSAVPTGEGDELSVSYLTLRYPQRTDLGGALETYLHLRPNIGGRSFLELTNSNAATRLFDITDPANVVRIDGQIGTNRWRGVVRNSQLTRTLLATAQPLAVPIIKPVTFRRIDPTKHNFLIVTHPVLRQPTGNEPDPVKAYARYRASDAGGGYDTLTVNIDALFDQFSYGERTPLAIRRFADYMLPSGDARPKFLFLIGQSRDPQGVRKNPNAALLDMVPSAGWPGSDLALVAGLNGEPAHVPAMAVGRLNAGRSQNVLDYLDKVTEHENTVEPTLWRKDVLHLSGGASSYELQAFRLFVDGFKNVLENQYVGARVTTIAKQTDNPTETVDIAGLVNRGVGMISMFGHSGLDVADLDIGFASNDRLGYRNKGRYPFLLANGCAAGNFYFGRPTFGTDWVLTPGRGAILFMAHTYNGFPFALKSYSDQLYHLLTDSSYIAKPIGQLQREAIRRYLADDASIYAITTAEQITLQGDPAVSVFPFTKPDLAIAPQSMKLTDTHGDSLRVRSDSIIVQAVIVNYGRVTNQPLTIRVRRFSRAGQLLREQRFTRPAPFYADTLQLRMPNDRATGEQVVEVRLDPDDWIAEGSETNNKAEASTVGKLTSLPFPADLTPPLIEVAFDGRRIGDGDIVSPRPVINVLLLDENPRLLRADTTDLALYLQRPCAAEPCPYERLSLQRGMVYWKPAGPDNAFRLTYQPALPLPDGRYTFEATGYDLSGNRAAPYRIHFVVKTSPELANVSVYPNPFVRDTRFTFVVTGTVPPADLFVQISDLSGRVVRTLRYPARIGLNEWHWDGTSDAGSDLPGGLYVYRLGGENVPDKATGVLTEGRLLLSR
ncbi:hypothetical protein BN8_03163 [Fibrisoma limi BUZ 3]|uniref:Uncharacterized protein n=1 Tax=Fibrisoma limi BUZ 3 TaxID=1185876 RepID=I2GJE9_9BACT|nr:C25 family cysteine peptidase [Fibrisoma limi]CCH54024.1 hypothetical protein BN8_03163 [Fibrisoma limi BUZ 3]